MYGTVRYGTATSYINFVLGSTYVYIVCNKTDNRSVPYPGVSTLLKKIPPPPQRTSFTPGASYSEKQKEGRKTGRWRVGVYLSAS